MALQIGHRQSEDLDFFSEKEFNKDTVLKALKDYLPTGERAKVSEQGFGFDFQLPGNNVKRRIDVYNWSTPFIRPGIALKQIPYD